MTTYRKPGTVEDMLDKALHVLSDDDLAQVGLIRNTLAKQSNPNQAARLPLEDAVKLDALLRARGRASMFMVWATRAMEQISGTLRRHQDDLPISTRMMRLCGEVGDLARAVTTAMEDQHLDLNERRQIASDAQEVIDAATALKQAIEPPAAGAVILSRVG